MNAHVTGTSAAIMMWCNIAPSQWSEFQRWHAQEHLLERVGVPGFLRGSRWHSRSRATGVLVIYELAHLQVFESPDYAERLNHPSPWTQRLMPSISEMVRTPSHVTVQAGGGHAASLLKVGFRPAAGHEPALRQWARDAAAASAAQPGLVSLRLLEAEHGLKGQRTAEHEIRGRADDFAEWCLIAIGNDASLDALAATLPASASAHRALDITTERYDLAHSLGRQELI